MRARSWAWVGAVLVLVAGSASMAAAADNVAGSWKWEIKRQNGDTREVTLKLKQEGEKLTGTYQGYYGASPLEGQVKENEIAFTVTMTIEGSKITGYFSGKVEGDSMGGAVEFEGAGSGKWNAIRAK